MKNIKSKIQKLALVAVVLIASGLLAATAEAVVVPAKSVASPVGSALFVPDSTNNQIKVYRLTNGSYQQNSTLSLTGKCYGLAVWQGVINGQETRMLLISVNNGTSSVLKYYKLESTGLPITAGYPKDIAISATGTSLTGIAITPDGSRAYLADAGNGRIYSFTYNIPQDSWDASSPAYVVTDYNLSDVAATNSLVFASTKVSSGKILAFDLNLAPKTGVTGLAYPTYLKVNKDGSRLYVSVNGASGGDIKVFSINANGLDAGTVKTISSPINVKYGWTGFDFSANEKHLFFSQPQDLSETQTKIYKVDLPLTGDVQVTDAQLVKTASTKLDSVTLHRDYRYLATTYSGDGSVRTLDLSSALNDPNFGNSQPPYPSNLRQMDSRGDIPARGSTSEDHIRVEFTISDPNGDLLTPKARYRFFGSNGAWTTVVGQAVSGINPTTAQITIPGPESSGFSAGEYEWEAVVQDICGSENTYPFLGPDRIANVLDFAVGVPPQAINTLSAAVGTNAGEVKLFWDAVSVASSYILKYSYSGPITTEAAFNAATTYPQTWTPLAAGQKEFKVLNSLTPGEKIWLSIKAVNTQSQAGALGNCAVTIVKNFVPAPVITKVYPNKGPNNQVNHIVIIGQNLFNDMTASIGTTPLVNVHQDSDTMVQADIPSGVPVGNYEITITCPGGTYDDAVHANPNNNFEVITPGSDTTAPALIANFAASDGENSRVTLTWTNPADGDLRKVVVMRKEGSYPSSPTDATATQVYQTNIPEPGASVSTVDTTVANGTTYYYAVFSQDTSGNWNNAVTAGNNADTGTPNAGSVVISNPTAARSGDTVGSAITISWQTDPVHSPVAIYYLERNADVALTAAEFTNATNWTAIANPAIIPNGDLDTFTDANQVGRGTQKYYTIVPQAHALTNADLAVNVVGKFDLTVGPEPEKLFVSLPIEPTDNSLVAVIGGQATEFDIAMIFDINNNVTQGSMRQGGNWIILPGAGAQLTSLNIGEGFGYATQTARYITVVGKVKENALSRTLTGNTTANWIATPYPYSFGIANAGLNGTSFNSGNVSQAAMAVYFDANAEAVGGIDGMAFHYAASEWREGTLQNQAPLILAPGKCYMLIEPGTNNVTWNITR